MFRYNSYIPIIIATVKYKNISLDSVYSFIFISFGVLFFSHHMIYYVPAYVTIPT